MLFDFNLAVDWRAGVPGGDSGGTLAYMAPERLRALAEPARGPAPSAAGRHRADLYALGLVLREALTGVPPHVPARPPGTDPRALAGTLASARERGPGPGLRGVPPPLRSI